MGALKLENVEVDWGEAMEPTEVNISKLIART